MFWERETYECTIKTLDSRGTNQTAPLCLLRIRYEGSRTDCSTYNTKYGSSGFLFFNFQFEALIFYSTQKEQSSSYRFAAYAKATNCSLQYLYSSYSGKILEVLRINCISELQYVLYDNWSVVKVTCKIYSLKAIKSLWKLQADDGYQLHFLIYIIRTLKLNEIASPVVVQFMGH